MEEKDIQKLNGNTTDAFASEKRGGRGTHFNHTELKQHNIFFKPVIYLSTFLLRLRPLFKLKLFIKLNAKDGGRFYLTLTNIYQTSHFDHCFSPSVGSAICFYGGPL